MRVSTGVWMVLAVSVCGRAEAAKEYKIATFSTYLNPASVKRTNNIKIAMKAISGKIVPPKGVFSLNRTVGERTQARGYRTAPVIENGKKVPGIGGGVSQVTGTLFNAVLLANMKIVEYRTHAKPPQYLPVGRDATVAWGRFDMKWKNPSKTPVRIEYKLHGNKLSAILWGRKTPGMKVNIKVNVLEKSENHIKAELYRSVRVKGKLVAKEKIGTSNYNWKTVESED